MKTKIALAAKASPVSEMASEAEQKQIADLLSIIFGSKPQTKAKPTHDDMLEYTWNNSSGQVYFAAEGNVEVFINNSGMPSLEFSAKNATTALTRLKAFAVKIAKDLDKQIAALQKRKTAIAQAAK